MGEVYRVRDAKLDREVAIKVLPAGFANDAELIGCVLQCYRELKGIKSDPGHVIRRVWERMKAFDIAHSCSVIEGKPKAS